MAEGLWEFRLLTKILNSKYFNNKIMTKKKIEGNGKGKSV